MFLYGSSIQSCELCHLFIGAEFVVQKLTITGYQSGDQNILVQDPLGQFLGQGTGSIFIRLFAFIVPP